MNVNTEHWQERVQLQGPCTAGQQCVHTSMQMQSNLPREHSTCVSVTCTEELQRGAYIAAVPY